MSLSRRALLKIFAATAAVAAVPGYLWQRGRALAARLVAMSPIDRSIPGAGTTTFSGDNPDRSHAILWNVPAFLTANAIPSFETAVPDERVPLVIVGGGISGLGTAWLLRDKAPVLLERAERFGGNARGESWQGIDYSIGAAYMLEADEGSELETLYREWQVETLVRVKTEDDPALVAGKMYQDFWSGESDPAAKAQFAQVRQLFLDVWEENGEAFYPEMPTEDATMFERLAALDLQSFRQYLETKTGGPIHPHIAAVLDHYCWSSLGGTWEEVSAAAGLNFFSAEFGRVMVAPGGNSGVAERVVGLLDEALPAGNLRPQSIVFNVTVRDDGVLVSYQDAAGTIRTILAEVVALCCPKFVVKRILTGIEPDRLAAIASLRYRSYLLANVLLTTELAQSFYDLFLTDVDTHRATDVVTATWAKAVPGHTVLTLYRAFPYDGARPTLLAPDAHAQFAAEFDQQIRTEILPALGVDAKHVAGVRLTRWGHPLPLAATGQLRAGIPAVLRQPFRDRVFFIEQDNWMLPAIETSLGEAIHFAPQIRQTLDHA